MNQKVKISWISTSVSIMISLRTFGLRISLKQRLHNTFSIGNAKPVAFWVSVYMSTVLGATALWKQLLKWKYCKTPWCHLRINVKKRNFSVTLLLRRALQLQFWAGPWTIITFASRVSLLKSVSLVFYYNREAPWGQSRHNKVAVNLNDITCWDLWLSRRHF